MKKVIEEFYCDICKEKSEVTQINYPVIFTTEQSAGISCRPYISQEKIEVCPKCLDSICKLNAIGCQGFNEYTIRR